MALGGQRARRVTETVTRAAGKVTSIAVTALVVAFVALAVALFRKR